MEKSIRSRNWTDESFEPREKIAGYLVRKDCELEGEEASNQLIFLSEWEDDFRMSEFAETEQVKRFIFRIQVEKARMKSILASRKCMGSLENLGKIKA